MPIVQEILKGVSDAGLMENQTIMPAALKALIKHYQKVSWNDARLPEITIESTGAQFKAAIAEMEPEQQVYLLYEYLKIVEKESGLTAPAAPDAPAKKQTALEVLKNLDPKDRNKARKAIVFVVGTLVFGGLFMLSGGLLFMALTQGAMSTNTFGMTTYFNTVVEAFKVIFAIKRSTT